MFIHNNNFQLSNILVPFFPKQISRRGILIYLICLGTVSLIFFRHMMKLDYIVIGIVWVLLFFLLSSRYSMKWISLPEKKFVRKLFWTAFAFRVVWVIFSFFFYIVKTGMPFEFGSSDAMGYHDEALWFREIGFASAWDYLSRKSIADAGYPVYLTLLYSVTGGSIIITRIIKSLLSAWMCVLMYRLAKRNVGEEAGRMTGIFCCLMPNLIMYCGLHLKETEMIFLTVAALERADALLRSPKVNVWNLILVALLVVSLFFFRTVLGATMIFAILSALVFSSNALMGRWNRVVLISWAIIALVVMAGGTLANETLSVWEGRSENQAAKRDYQVYKGIKWAKYATGSVMAPIMFVLPFPTMVDVDEQYNQQLINGGNYVRNFFGIFTLIALFSAIFIKKNWRDLALIGAFIISYLGVICMSGFANSERFLLPGLPFLLLMAAYGVSLLDERNFKWVRIWYYIVPVMVISWAVFKLGSRGIL